MNIVANTTHNPMIDVAVIDGDLTDSAVLGLQRYLYNCLDSNRSYQIIDLKHTQKIDKLAISILEDFGFQGIQISLINARTEIINALDTAGRGKIVKNIYDVTDSKLAVSLFEKELLLSDC